MVGTLKEKGLFHIVLPTLNGVAHSLLTVREGVGMMEEAAILLEDTVGTV